MISYAVRTHVGPVIGVVSFLLFGLNLYQRWGVWAGEVTWAVDIQGIALFIVALLVCASVAVDTARASTPGRSHLVKFSRRPRLGPYWFAAMSVLIPVYAAQVLATATAVTYAMVNGGDIRALGPALLQTAVHASIIFFMAALGSLIGRFTSPLTAGMLSVIIGFLIFNMHSVRSGEQFDLLALGGATASLLGRAYSVTFLFAQLTIFLAAGLLIFYCSIRLYGTLRLPTISGTLGLLLAVSILLMPKGFLPESRFNDDPRTPAVCAGTDPVYCTYSEHGEFRNKSEPYYRAFFEQAKSSGYSAFVPDEMIQGSASYVPHSTADKTVFAVWFDDEWDAEHLPYYMANELWSPNHCPQLHDGSGDWWQSSEFQQYAEKNEQLMLTALSLTGWNLYGDDFVPLTPDQVASIIDEFNRCDF